MELFSLGERLMIYRKRKGFSKKAMAEMLGVTVATLSNYENDVTEPDIECLTDMALALNVTVNKLFTGFGTPKKKDSLSKSINISPAKLQMLAERSLI